MRAATAMSDAYQVVLHLLAQLGQVELVAGAAVVQVTVVSLDGVQVHLLEISLPIDARLLVPVSVHVHAVLVVLLLVVRLS